MLSQAFFFKKPVAQPESWSGSIQGGKYYHLSDSVAQRVWRDVTIELASRQAPAPASPFGGYGNPYCIRRGSDRERFGNSYWMRTTANAR